MGARGMMLLGDRPDCRSHPETPQPRAEHDSACPGRPSVLEQKVGGSIPASDEVKKPEGFPGTYGRPPRRKIEIVMGTLQ
ncbi:hypothetical protein PAPYR_11387 [Paratrimastix pyriformis]|uniref:Uncharacterized protein n=1 Tax=Paratrimastix pyriformis TaxID=342808 RepID=A0ABQ8U8U8_9EUKA|nr:hypothetical protein PAPYR_11387 [Paratrimastix pyriformis]